jgi:hypothetical protein
VNGDPVAHLPREVQGMLGPHTAEMDHQIRATLQQMLK